MSKGKRPVKSKPAAHRSKRERFEEAGRFPVKKVAIVGVVVVVIAVAAVVGIREYKSSQQVGGTVVSQGGANYSNAKVDMALLTSDQKTTTGTVTLSAAEVAKDKIGGFVYSRSTPMPAGYNMLQGNGLPVLAYVAPSGRLVVATSMCEPCRSYQFHIEGNNLVCNTCFTHWDLDTLKGVSGGCLDFPPQEVKTVVQGDTIQLQQSQLEAWTPRI